MKLRNRKTARRGAAVVEFAVCAPLVVLIGFGFVNAGLLVQMKYNSKLIGHMAATELFKTASRTSSAVTAIEEKYEDLAESLGIAGLDVSIAESDEIAVVTTSMSVLENSPIPLNFHTADNIGTETHVYAPFSSDEE